MRDRLDLIGRDEEVDDEGDVSTADSHKRKRPRMAEHFWDAFHEWLKRQRETWGTDYRDERWTP